MLTLDTNTSLTPFHLQHKLTFQSDSSVSSWNPTGRIVFVSFIKNLDSLDASGSVMESRGRERIIYNIKIINGAWENAYEQRSEELERINALSELDQTMFWKVVKSKKKGRNKKVCEIKFNDVKVTSTYWEGGVSTLVIYTLYLRIRTSKLNTDVRLKLWQLTFQTRNYLIMIHQ